MKMVYNSKFNKLLTCHRDFISLHIVIGGVKHACTFINAAKIFVHVNLPAACHKLVTNAMQLKLLWLMSKNDLRLCALITSCISSSLFFIILLTSLDLSCCG
jgi:hypothetical protein